MNHHPLPKYQLIYDSIASQIREGAIAKGTSLPSIRELRIKYNASATTVRTALDMLSGRRYISTGRGRQASVIYSASDAETDAGCHSISARKKEAFPDVLKTAGLLLPPLAVQSAYHCGTEEVSRLRSCADSIQKPGLTMHQCISGCQDYFRFLLKQLGSPFAGELFEQLSSFLFLPASLTDCASNQKELLQNWLADFTDRLELRSYSGIRQSFAQLNPLLLSAVSGLIASLPPVPPEEQLPFLLRDRQRQSLYLDLVLSLMQKIDLGIYPEGSTLPSIAELSLHYGLSEITVRNALRLLNQTGVTKTVNGKGTGITIHKALERDPDLSIPMIQESMTCLLDALHILALTCRACFQDAADGITEEEIWQLEALCQRENACFPGSRLLPFLHLMTVHTPSPSLRTIAKSLFAMLQRGYFLQFSKGADRLFSPSSLNALLLKSLKQRDVGRFCQYLQEDLYFTFEAVKEILLEYGISSARRISCSTINLYSLK